ncbi:hypothetical protein B0X71_10645 [Planococcus lenghuensis]|uniref:Uncharacterized protein n=1 Tax=Planococcus lenghuensis TaxID=2213202 RepID=A0A1Q2KZ54_9BACL|nr:hypothetical protein B0X71_10645 [Planococcus lenghuensis]
MDAAEPETRPDRSYERQRYPGRSGRTDDSCRKLMQREGIEVPAEVFEYAESREKAGNTAIFAAMNGNITGVFSIADRIRDDAPAALAAMQKNGISQIIMLTGDNRHTASLVADALQLDDYRAEMLPEDKVAFVKELQTAGHVVVLAGSVHLASGMFIHEASVLAVILNAMRLVHFNSSQEASGGRKQKETDRQTAGCPVCTPSH